MFIWEIHLACRAGYPSLANQMDTYEKSYIKPSSPVSNNFQKYIGQFSRHRDHRIMARWQLSQTPSLLTWRKCSRRQYARQYALYE